MIESLLIYAGTEIGNNARTQRYLGGGAVQTRGDCSCGTVPAAIGQDLYVTPASDMAPWYDPSEPRSANFGGLWIETIDGIKDSPFERRVTQRVADGAVRSRGRMRSKTITVTGWLFAADCCSADFGLRWLTAALNTSCVTCTGNDLCFLACCPNQVPEGTPDAAQGPDGRWYDTPGQIRTMTGAALISGPTVVSRAPGCGSGSGCGDLDDGAEGFPGVRPIYRVQFVMDADPCVWRQPVSLLDETLWPLPTGDEPCNVQFATGCCDVTRPGCQCRPPCAADDLCPAPAPPPTPPPATPACICVPLQVVRQCVDVAPEQVPIWEDASLTIRLFSGSAPLRNLVINVWPNLLDRDPDDLSECNACGQYYVTYVPANSTLTIDGRTCSASMHCPGDVTTNASTAVYGSAGGPIQCIRLSCGIRYTVCADVDIRHVSPEASLSVDLVRCETTA